MMNLLQEPLIIRLAVSLLLVGVVLGLRHLAARRIMRGAHILQESQRRQLFYLRTAVTAALLIGMMIIWAGQLQNLVLSLTAVMVAVVIATKELLMCLSGFLLRTTGRLFSVGDLIECNGLYGEVTDHTLLSTTLLEIEAPADGYRHTGRNLILPNSLFLSHPVHTWAFARQYVLHRFAITLEQPVDAPAALERLQAEAVRACAPFREQAQEVNEAIDRRLGVDVAGPDPVTMVGTSDIGKLQFRVLLFCPRSEAAVLERDICAAFLHAPGPAVEGAH